RFGDLGDHLFEHSILGRKGYGALSLDLERRSVAVGALGVNNKVVEGEAFASALEGHLDGDCARHGVRGRLAKKRQKVVGAELDLEGWPGRAGRGRGCGLPVVR